MRRASCSSRHGYQEVSIRKIAERIEYSPAAIYSYFPSKDDIFFALAEEGFRLLFAFACAAHAAPADPIDEHPRDVLALLRIQQGAPEYFALMFLDRSVPAHQQATGSASASSAR